MRVVYISILKEIDLRITAAEAVERSIDYIELAPVEWRDFRLELVNAWGHFGSTKGPKDTLYRGVTIQEK